MSLSQVGNYGRYETVAASQTAQALGTTGAAGDYIHRLVCVVATAATATVALLDGDTSISVLPAISVEGTKTYVIELGMVSVEGGWSVTTGAGVSVIAVGRFS